MDLRYRCRSGSKGRLLDAGKAVQDVDPAALAARLRKQQAVLDLKVPANGR